MGLHGQRGQGKALKEKSPRQRVSSMSRVLDSCSAGSSVGRLPHLHLKDEESVSKS